LDSRISKEQRRDSDRKGSISRGHQEKRKGSEDPLSAIEREGIPIHGRAKSWKGGKKEGNRKNGGEKSAAATLKSQNNLRKTIRGWCRGFLGGTQEKGRSQAGNLSGGVSNRQNSRKGGVVKGAAARPGRKYPGGGIQKEKKNKGGP